MNIQQWDNRAPTTHVRTANLGARSNRIMFAIISAHIKSLYVDLDTCRREGDWSINPAQQEIYDAGMIALRDVIEALDTYYISINSVRLHQDLITIGMDFTLRWESWISTLGPGSLKSASSKLFHEYLLRFTKGALKYYRIWRIDSNK